MSEIDDAHATKGTFCRSESFMSFSVAGLSESSRDTSKSLKSTRVYDVRIPSDFPISVKDQFKLHQSKLRHGFGLLAVVLIGGK